VLVAVERDGYTDSSDGVVSFTDALYYTTVTLTTTGYGDITPVSTSARLVNALLVTPMRLLFVVILVGTTIQALTERSREQFRITRWRSRVKDHIVVLGYGTKGRNAVRSCCSRGVIATRSSWSRSILRPVPRPPRPGSSRWSVRPPARRSCGTH